MTRNVFFATISGLCLAIPFLFDGLGFFSLFAFAPLFYVIDDSLKAEESPIKAMLFVCIALFVWVLCSVWWLFNASFWGLFVAIFLYPFLLLFPFFLLCIYLKTKKQFAYVVFVLSFISLEWLFLHYDIIWPWLILGNAFARSTMFIQWYAYTGVLGGSLWILLSNIAIYETWRKLKMRQKISIGHFMLTFSLMVPVFFSFYLKSQKRKVNDTVEVVVVQPNIDSYTEKFSKISAASQMKRMIYLSDSLITSQTRLLVLPETAIPCEVFESEIRNNAEVKTLMNYSKDHRNVTIVCGIITKKLLRQNDTSYYNSSLCISGDSVAIYRKSKLLLGVEAMPMSQTFPWLNKLLLSFGQKSVSFCTQNERTVFRTKDADFSSLICYESIFGAFVSDFVQNGAQFIVLISNDGWWGNTPGYKQHASFSSLRAIEQGCCIVRSANTGISCVIDSKGEKVIKTDYGKQAAFRSRIQKNSTLTMYARYGDVIGVFCIYFLLLVFGWIFAEKIGFVK